MNRSLTLRKCTFLLVGLIIIGQSTNVWCMDNTHVSNGFGSELTVMVTHPGGRNDLLRIEPGQTRNVPTSGGIVTVSVYDPADEYSEFPYESMNLPSDRSVVVKQNYRGKPKLHRVRYGTLWEVEDGIL